MYLENRIQEKKDRNIKTSEVMLVNINQEVRRKRTEKIGLEPTPATLCRCAREETCEKTTRRSMEESLGVGHAEKSIWWMPWH